MRAMGLSKSQTTRVFMYEAFVVMVTAMLMGVLVGLCVALSLTA